jgi:Zn-dependent metalloprotease
MAPVVTHTVLVDAVTDSILSDITGGTSFFGLGDAQTLYSGTRPILWSQDVQNRYLLKYDQKPKSVVTYDLSAGTPALVYDVRDAADDGIWNDQNEFYDLQWAAGLFYEYCSANLNYKGVDGNGAPLVLYGKVPGGAVGEFDLVDGIAKFGSGENAGNGSIGPLVALDLVAHEFGHGVEAAQGLKPPGPLQLEFGYEGGAVSEGLADLFGMSLRRADKPDADWRMFIDVPTSGSWDDIHRVGFSKPNY